VKRAAILLSLAVSGLALNLSGCVSTAKDKFQKPQPERAAEINLEIGIDHLRKNNLAQAKEKIDRSLEQNPRSAKAQIAAGMLYDRLGETDKADDYYARSLSLEPKNPDIQNNYAVYLCQKKRYERGEKLATEAAKNPLYRTPEVGYMNAGNCARGNGDLKSAEENFRRAIAVRPKFGEALFQMAELEYVQTDYLSARAFLQRYMEVSRTSPATLWLGVRIERGLGNTDAAQQYGQRLKNEYPSAAQTKELLESERNSG
jgi:type IV pilus assembly protein PilF